ncbi:MAG: hypothetical protein QXV04_05530 [Desulfurococcaceae archaeon]
MVNYLMYPELDVHLRNPINVIATSGEPGLERAIYFMAKNNMSLIYVVSSRNLTYEFVNITNDPEDF